MGEWSLIIFTTAMPASVGAFFWATVRRSRKTNAGLGTNSLVVLGLAIIGMLGSLFHLGSPLLAPYAVLNFGSSWLSREIVFASLFFVLLVLSIVLDRTHRGSGGFRTAFAWVTTIVGLLVILSSAQVYMSTVVPAWQSWYTTLVDSYATMLVLGGIVFILTSRKALGDDLLRLGLFILAVVLLQLALLPNYLAGLGAGDVAAQSTASLLAGTYGVMMAIRWVLVVGGVFLLVLSQMMKERGLNYLYVAAIALIVGQVIGRYLFYATKVVVAIG